jgi:lycopene cyclase domain-containing protein
MRSYDTYNLLFGGFVLTVSYWLVGPKQRTRQLLLAARIALLLTVIYYPWDFFAIRLGVWTYPTDPGVKIYQVPLNDLVFIWLCSFLTCCVLVATQSRLRMAGHGETSNLKKTQ